MTFPYLIMYKWCEPWLKYSSAAFFPEMLWEQLCVSYCVLVVAWAHTEPGSVATGSITAKGLGKPSCTVSWRQLWDPFGVTRSQTSAVKEVLQQPQLIIPDNVCMRVTVANASGTGFHEHEVRGQYSHSRMMHTQAVTQLCPTCTLQTCAQTACLPVSHSLLFWPADFSVCHSAQGEQ